MADLMNAQLDFCFPTPVMCHVWDDSEELNAELRRLILAREREDRGRTKSNIGGWHSETGLLEWCGEAGKYLFARTIDMVNHASRQLMVAHGRDVTEFDWTYQAWVNINHAGGFNRTHTHPGATWSGTYYVDPGNSQGNAEGGTPLELLDPCMMRENVFFPASARTKIQVYPVAGMMILFPSYLPHMVFPHRGDRPRISIAFNFRREPFP